MDYFNKSKKTAKPLVVVGDYKLQRTLGKGGTGKVKLAINQKTGEKIAVKIVNRAGFNFDTKAEDGTPYTKEQLDLIKEKEKLREVRTMREVHIMKLLSHPNIIRLRGLKTIDSYFYIFMDYVNGGQLLHFIINRKKLTEKHACHFSRQIVSALDYMHRNSIVHRDLKIENILIDKKGENIKIIDFGLSNLFYPERRLTTYCGSLYFSAPELLLSMPYKGPEIDIWSLGVVIYMMVTGSVPFDDESLIGLHGKIIRGQVNYPSYLTFDCQDLLSCIFVIDPNQRIILSDIIKHPWMNNTNGFKKSIENHLPLRLPLSLPLSSDIVEKISQNFNLGSLSADGIKTKLEKLILSSTYQTAAEHVARIQNVQLTSNIIPYTNKWGFYTDPQVVPEAYHPLISLYYLTKENIIESNTGSNSKVTSRTTESSFPGKTKAGLGNTLNVTVPAIIASPLSNRSELSTYLYDDDASCSLSIVDTPLNTPVLSDFELDLVSEIDSSKSNLHLLASKFASLMINNFK